MKKYSVLCAMMILFVAQALDAKVLWLDDPSKRSIFEKGLYSLTKRFEESETQTVRTMKNVLDIYIDKQSVHYEDDKHKIFVDVFARVSRHKNVPKSCRALISKAKRVLFGTAVKENLKSQFSSIGDKDLRTFIKFRGKVETYGIKNSRGKMSPISPKIELDDLPSQARPIKTIMCTNNVLSDKVLFYKK